MTDIADKIYAATGLTLNAEAAAKVGHMIRLARQEAADEIEKLRAALQSARRDALEEAARRVEIMWLMFREKDNGASDWIFRAHDDIPTGDDFVAAIRALGEKE